MRKKCSVCGKEYYRRNLIEAWTKRNPGRRKGWHKDIARVCNTCMPIDRSETVLTLAYVEVGKRKGRG